MSKNVADTATWLTFRDSLHSLRQPIQIRLSRRSDPGDVGGEAVSTTRRHGASADTSQLLVWNGHQMETMLIVIVDSDGVEGENGCIGSYLRPGWFA